MSIITIVLNGESEVEQTLLSVVNQSYTNIEYIVIDGGSLDNTSEYIDRYKEHIDVFISEPDKGISDAFNKGLKHCSGEIVGIVNCGDWYEQDTVQTVVDTFVQHPETDVLCGAQQYWQGQEKAFLCTSVPELLEKDMSVTHPSCFIKRDLYLLHGGFSLEYKFAMDYDLLLRFFSRGVRFRALPTVLVNMQHCGISELHWQKALQETHLIRQRTLPRSLFATRPYYYFVLLKRYSRIFLEKMGLTGLIRFYRKRLARVKKYDSCPR